MKKILIFLLVVLPVYIPQSLGYLDKNYFAYPVQYKRDIVIRSDGWGDGFFAANRNGRRLHQGIDLLAEVETPVLAARSGKVVSAKQNNGMGKYIIIKHADNITSIYGHLSKIYVTNDEFVRQGQIIGLVGKTGNANYRGIQPHLHFEIRKGGVPADPLEYLS
jgi:murein DD-endopeptidase MepM/ murein hydrolase activator NlpD